VLFQNYFDPKLFQNYICEKLPTLEDLRLDYKLSSSSGETTKATKAPTLLLDEPLEPIYQHAVAAVEAAWKKNQKLRIFRLPETCDLAMQTETDIVDAAMSYIVLPTMEVLSTFFPGQYLKKAELTTFEEHGNSAGRKLKSTSLNRLRYDLSFHKKGTGTIGAPGTKRRADRNPKTDEVIAVVEFKRGGQVDYEKDFKPAVYPRDTPPAILAQKTEDAEHKESQTLLVGNGKTFTKQVSSYALRGSCPHVALFDWENLLLFNFDQMDVGSGDVGDRAKLIWVNENNGDYIRKAFLEWVIKAFEDKGMKIPL
jgi:hypothetical protein